MIKKVNKICQSCTAVFWVTPGVVFAYCPSCGRKNQLNKWAHRHGSKTVRKSNIFDSQGLKKVKTEKLKAEKLKIKEIAKKRTKARKLKLLEGKITIKTVKIEPKKEHEMTDIMKSFNDAALAIQAVVNSVKKEGDAAKASLATLAKFMEEQKAIAAKNAADVVITLKKEVTHGMGIIKNEQVEIRKDFTKGLRKTSERLTTVETFGTDHLEKHASFHVKLKEAAEKANEMAKNPVSQKVEAK